MKAWAVVALSAMLCGAHAANSEVNLARRASRSGLRAHVAAKEVGDAVSGAAAEKSDETGPEIKLDLVGQVENEISPWAGAGFGSAVCGLGDVNGDGIADVGFGSSTHRVSSKINVGAFYVQLLDKEGKSGDVVSYANPSGKADENFGTSCAGLGDVNQDGVPDAVVGVPMDSKGSSAGEVRVLFLAKSGKTSKSVTIAGSKHGVKNGGLFGTAVAGLGHFFDSKSQDGMTDVVVGAPNNKGGSVHLLQLLKDGSVGKSTVIASGSPNLGDLSDSAQFGSSVVFLGDINGDGVGDIAVGAPGADGGSVFVLLLTKEGGVKESSQISADADLFAGREIRRMGESLFTAGDLDGNGVPDLLIGLPFEAGEGGQTMGGASVLALLQSTGKPVPGAGQRFASPLFRPSAMGRGFDSASVVARFPTARQVLLAVGNPGALHADDGITTGNLRTFRLTADPKSAGSLGSNETKVTGALFPYLRSTGKAHDCAISDWSDWSSCSVKCGIGYIHRDRTIFEEAVGMGKACPTNIVEHESCDKGPCEPASVVDFGTLSDQTGGFAPKESLEKGDRFGDAVASIGDFNGDERYDIAVGSPSALEGRGQVYVMAMGEDYIPEEVTVLGSAKGGIEELPAKAGFGSAIAGLGDLNQDGVPDVVVGAEGQKAIYVLTMTKAGKAGKAHLFSLENTEHRPRDLSEGAVTGIGASAVGVGMLLGDDDVPDAAVGLPALDGGKGGVLLLQLAADGTVAGTVLLRATDLRKEGGGPSDACGASVAYLGDVNGDGVGDIAIGCPGARSDSGEILVALLSAKGEAKSVTHIHGATTGFNAKVTGGSRMGASLVGVGDVDGDGIVDVAAGAPSSNARDPDAGALYVILLNPTGHLKHVSRSLPAGGMYGAHAFASVSVIDFTPDNRTLVLAAGAPDAKAADNARASGQRVGAVVLGHMSVEQRSDTVGDLPTFPTLHIPRDCVLSEWTPYSNCSESCDGGVQFRTRAILVKNEPGGRACDQFEYEQSRVCNTQHCPIDCIMADWGEWGNCSTECDGGVQFRSRAVQVFPDFGGKACSGNTTERRACNTQGCPSACEVTPWSEWGECSEPCGGGEQERNRSVIAPPLNGGGVCPNTTETRECNKQHCPIECEVGPWTDWSMCNTTCGGGVKQRSREIVQRPMYGADACPALDDEEACNTHDCPFDCKMSDWSEWGECSEWCGEGVRERHRDILKYPSPDGVKCGNTTEAQECEARPCPIDCEVAKWGEWSECNAECGPGRKHRSRKVKVQPKHGGEDCPALEEEDDCLEKHCPIDCVVGQWGNWSACDPGCGPGEQDRKRRVLVEPDFGGKECPALKEAQECNAKPCPIDCEVSEWEFVGGCSEQCGTGERKRKRHVTVKADHGGKACPALTGVAPCNTFACAKPVLDTAPCAQFGNCAECTADDRCGWARSVKKCIPGVVRGPTPLWTASPHYLEDPYKEFLHMTGITEWEFSYCRGAKCGEYKTCDGCIADPLCGFCPSSGQCLYGNANAPTRGEYCPRGWTFAPELSSNHTEVIPREGEARITEPRPSHAQLKALCEADTTTRSLLWKRLVADAEQPRPADNCLPCEGQYPFCDCSSHLDADAAAADPSVAELAAAAASAAERQLAEEAAEAQARAAESAVQEATDTDVSGTDQAFEDWEAKQRSGIADRAAKATDGEAAVQQDK